jgi:hypothetical protein
MADERTPMRGRWIIVASAVLISGSAIGLVVLIDRDAASDARASSVEPSSAASTRALAAAMEQQAASLRTEVARQFVPPQLPPDPAETPENAATREAQRAERKASALREQHRALAFLDAQVATGARDPAWASTVRADLTKGLAPTPGSAIRAVECNSTLCRAELSHPDQRRLDRFAETLSDTSRGNFQLFYEREGDGFVATVFFTREGQELPNVARALAVLGGDAPSSAN